MQILSWLTRDEDIHVAGRVPYRLLEEAADLTAGDPAVRNVLIQGDNLGALKTQLLNWIASSISPEVRA